MTRLASDFARPRVQDYTIGIAAQLPLGLVLLGDSTCTPMAIIWR